MDFLRRLLGQRALPESGGPVPLVLYSRPGCHLCDVMRAEIARAPSAGRVSLTEIDIESDAELETRFGRSIPVLEIAGKLAFKGRLTVEDFERKLARLS